MFSTVDEWLRHRLRMMQLKQWKRGTTIYREMRRLGASVDAARQVAMNSRRWWKNSAQLRHTALPTTTGWESRDLPTNLNQPNRRMRTRMSRWCGRGVAVLTRYPLSRFLTGHRISAALPFSFQSR